MAILNLFSQDFPGKWTETLNIIDDVTFDHHMNTGYPSFETEDGRKKIVWKDNQPYGFHTELGRLIRFRSLHFQGHAKPLIPSFVRDPLPESIRD